MQLWGSPPSPTVLLLQRPWSFCVNACLAGFKQLSLARGSKCTHLDVPLWRMRYQSYKAVALQGRLRAAGGDSNGRSTAKELPNLTAKPYSTMEVDLPAIDCIFSWKCHPEYESVREECDAWTLSLFDPPLPLHGPERVLYLKGLYPLFTCTFYPSTPSRRRLVLATNLINWLFVLDDMLEHAEPHTSAELVQGFQSLLISSLGGLRAGTWGSFPAPSQSGGSVPCRMGHTIAFVERLRCEVLEEMLSDMSTSLRLRVVASLLTSLNAMREHGHIMHRMTTQEGLEEYRAGSTNWSDQLMVLRLQDSFEMPLMVLMEYMLAMDLQDIIATTRPRGEGGTDLQEKVETLKLGAVKHATWVNDLLSLRKEHFKSERLSTVRVLLMRRGVDCTDECGEGQLQEVIKELWAMIQEQERSIARLLEDIKAAGHDKLVMYGEEVCRAVAGNMYWSTLTARYNGLDPLPWNTPISLSIPSDKKFPTLAFLQRTA